MAIYNKLHQPLLSAFISGERPSFYAELLAEKLGLFCSPNFSGVVNTVTLAPVSFICCF